MNIITDQIANSLLWLFATIGVFNVIGKPLGQIIVKTVRKGESIAIAAIPNEELRENAKTLIKQAEAWFVGQDGKAKMDWVLSQVCKGYPIIESVARPIIQSAYDEIRKELKDVVPQPVQNVTISVGTSE